MAAEGESGPRPPSNADFNQIFNRIALARAKHERVLSLAGRRPITPPVTPPASSTTASTSTRITAAKAEGRFSSLAASSNTTTTTTTTSSSSRSQTPSSASTKATTMDPRLADDLDPPLPDNVGIGYIAPASSSSLNKPPEDREKAVLRQRVLGRNAARQLAERERQQQQQQQPGGRKKKGGDGSDSEEEVGKGALVKGKKRPAVVVVDAGIRTGDGSAQRRGREEEEEESRRKRRKRVRVEAPDGAEDGSDPRAPGGGRSGVQDEGDKRGKGQDTVDLRMDSEAVVESGDVRMNDKGAEEERQERKALEVSEQKGVEGEKKKKKKNKNKKKKKKKREKEQAREAKGDAESEDTGSED